MYMPRVFLCFSYIFFSKYKYSAYFVLKTELSETFA